MSHSPPVDQRIVDEYFRLASKRKTQGIAWLLGMTATFGLTPEQLSSAGGFTWDGINLIVAGRKRAIRPLHPQWVLLFQLKEKQPHDVWSCWGPLVSRLYRAMALQEISMNVTDLILAHSMRKKYYTSLKQQRTVASFAGAS
jgi:hypothetical protein